MTASLLHHLVTDQAARRPEDTALVMSDARMSYGQLEVASNQVARLLAEAGCAPGDRIGLLLPKSVPTVAGLLGALKAGCVYVPMDLASPAARLARIVEACEPALVLVEKSGRQRAIELRDAVPQSAGLRFGTLDPAGDEGGPDVVFTGSDLEAMPQTAPSVTRGSSDLAHILFTSGSTGQPKGVMITHQNVLAFVRWACRYFAIAAGDRTSGHPPLHFDLSTFDMFGSFAAGAELHLVPPEMSLLPHKLADFIRDRELTQWFSVPSLLAYMMKFDVVKEGDFPKLKRLLWCGEVFPTPALIYWMQRLPHVTFTNLYGPTEATIASSYYTVPAIPAEQSESVPIGKPCDGEDLLVLDDQLKPVSVGEIGDLYIAGAGLSPGYWRDQERTDAAFIPDPRGGDPDARIYKTGDLAKADADGLVYFLGRADSQIKSRGYRIELGEIETAINSVNSISESAVVAIDGGGFEGAVICCAYACKPAVTLAPKDLRELISAKLPKYMLPAHWLAMDVLPKNANGKIDRRTLREKFEHGKNPSA